MRIVIVLRGDLVRRLDIFVRKSVFVYEGCSEDSLYLFFFFTIQIHLFLHCDSKPCTYVDIYIEVVITVSPISSCIVSFLSLCTCFLFIVCNLLFLFHTNVMSFV